MDLLRFLSPLWMVRNLRKSTQIVHVIAIVSKKSITAYSVQIFFNYSGIWCSQIGEILQFIKVFSTISYEPYNNNTNKILINDHISAILHFYKSFETIINHRFIKTQQNTMYCPVFKIDGKMLRIIHRFF